MKDSIHPVDKIVGANIRRLRETLGLSQENVAEAIGVTFQQVQKYEKGANRVSASKLYMIAGTLEVEVGEFFKGTSSAPPTPAPSRKVSADTMRLANDFQRIKSPQARQAIHNVVREVLKNTGDDEAIAA